eukprot:11301420-Alexandrium_andersonii.AAC.1
MGGGSAQDERAEAVQGQDERGDHQGVHGEHVWGKEVAHDRVGNAVGIQLGTPSPAGGSMQSQPARDVTAFPTSTT